ncbi:hypothetical protein ACOZ4L_12470 [Haloplanus ruber]|uniref:hypothetical protein n=1 Tax=Haloplanus ruber TaxID=869892 RepID=UPI002111FCAE|nr:hypothetical protein [Haloplanus ruber]
MTDIDGVESVQITTMDPTDTLTPTSGAAPASVPSSGHPLIAAALLVTRHD